MCGVVIDDRIILLDVNVLLSSEEVGTLLQGECCVVRDKETMLLDPDTGGLPGLKSEPIPAPGP